MTLGNHQESNAEKGARDHVEPFDASQEVTWGADDAECPHQWSTGYRIWITFMCSFVTMNVTFASSVPSSAIKQLHQSFSMSIEESQLITALFLVGYLMGPFFWGPGSELVGRKPVLIATLLASGLFSMADAVADNRTTLFVCRFLAGLFAVAPLALCGGVIADVWNPVGRGPAMAAGAVCPSHPPCYLSGVDKDADIFWLLFAWSLFCAILVALCLPETFSPILLKRRAARLRKADPVQNSRKWAPLERADRSLSGRLHATLVKPFDMLFNEPILMVITLYLSVVYTLLYMLFEAFPIIWEDLRGFNDGQSGLIFLGILIGSCLGGLVTLGLSHKYARLYATWRDAIPPEYRLEEAIVAGPCLIIGIFWLGWTGAYASVPWYIPALATVPIGASFNLLFISFWSYIVDMYLDNAASALAANTTIRCALAAGSPMYTTQLFNNLGVQWASTLLGLISLLLAPSPYLFYRMGPRLRAKSKFAPNLDLRRKEGTELGDSG